MLAAVVGVVLSSVLAVLASVLETVEETSDCLVDFVVLDVVPGAAGIPLVTESVEPAFSIVDMKVVGLLVT